MALISKSIAIIPVGISCITNIQLNKNISFISKQFSESFKEMTCPFCYALTSARDISKIIHRLFDDDLITIDSITYTENKSFPHYTFENFNYWFWHEEIYTHNNSMDTKREIAKKFNHLRDNFVKYADSKYCILILCNAQANLHKIYPVYTDDMLIYIDAYTIMDIEATIKKYFKNCRLVSVLHSQRYLDDSHYAIDILENSERYFIPKVENYDDFKGIQADWQKIFLSIINKTNRPSGM